MAWGLGDKEGQYNDVFRGLDTASKVDAYFESPKVQKILEKSGLKHGEDYYTVSGVLYVKTDQLGNMNNMLSRLKVFNEWFNKGEAQDTEDRRYYAIDITGKK